MPDLKLPKFTRRLVQPDIDDNDSSLLAKAFRSRVLSGFEADPALLYPAASAPRRVRVAVYNDKGGPLVLLRKFAFTIVAPLIALLIVAVILLNTLVQPKVSVPIQNESVALSDVPVPAGVRAIGRAKLYTVPQFTDVYLNQALPNYTNEYKGGASYISPQSPDDLKAYYSTKLLQNKALRWQTFGKSVTFNLTYTTLYLRALPSQVAGTVEGLIVQIEPVDATLLKKDPTAYDAQAKLGETVIILTKSWLVPR